MKNIVIFGAPGAGKGTQSDFIVASYGLTHVSTGDLLRKEIAEQTELGKRIKSIIKEIERHTQISVHKVKIIKTYGVIEIVKIRHHILPHKKNFDAIKFLCA